MAGARLCVIYVVLSFLQQWRLHGVLFAVVARPGLQLRDSVNADTLRFGYHNHREDRHDYTEAGENKEEAKAKGILEDWHELRNDNAEGPVGGSGNRYPLCT